MKLRLVRGLATLLGFTLLLAIAIPLWIYETASDWNWRRSHEA